MMDISDTLAPDSQQLDAVDLLGGEQTFRIEKVSKGPADQPVQIHLAGFPRPWRPGKSMRRVLVACWGPDASVYVGRSVTLFCDNTVVFGGAAVGGTRIRALSHIDEPQKVPLLISKGRSAMFTVQLLTESPEDALRREWKSATPERRKEIEAEVQRLANNTAEPAADETDPWVLGERADEPSVES